jgi:hypothetical protein
LVSENHMVKSFVLITGQTRSMSIRILLREC